MLKLFEKKYIVLISLLGFILTPLIITLMFLFNYLAPLTIIRYPLFLSPLHSHQFIVENLPFNLYHETHEDIFLDFFYEDRLYIPEIEGILVDFMSPRMVVSMQDNRYITYDNRLYFTVDDSLSLLNDPFHYFNLIVGDIVNLYRYNYDYFNYVNSVIFPQNSFEKIQNHYRYSPFADYVDVYNLSIFLDLSSHRGFYERITELVILLNNQNNLMNNFRFRYFLSIGSSFLVTAIILVFVLKKNNKNNIVKTADN